MVQHDLTAFCRPFLVISLCALLASNHVAECQRTVRSPRPAGLWNSLFGAVVSSLSEHVKRQRAREATQASSRLDTASKAVINDENSIQTEVTFFLSDFNACMSLKRCRRDKKGPKGSTMVLKAP